MPTENRSSNTDPRDVFIRLNPLGLGEAELRKDSTGFEDQRTHSDYLLFLAGYRETHAEPQANPEPIAWMVDTAFWWIKEEAERDAAATGLPIVGLGPMAGHGEVERCEARLHEVASLCASVEQERYALRAQLAEAHALLREADEFMYIMTAHDGHAKLAHRYGKDWWNAIDKLRGKVCTALSASAEPEAT